MTPDPHRDARIVTAGAPQSRARFVMVMLHGRGASASDMVGLAAHLALPDVAVLAPEAAGHSWWPQSFLAPPEANEPGLGSALRLVERILDDLAEGGVAPERTVLAGFSQGACLALEAAARRGGPFHAVAALSGGLVGTGEAGGAARADLYGHTARRFDYAASLHGTDAYLSRHERDPHIPLARVEESARVLEALGARVETAIHPGAGHGVLEADVRALRARLNAGPGG